MACSIPVRKSGRRRVPTKKYTTDASKVLDSFKSDSEEDFESLQQLQDLKDDDFPDHLGKNDDEESLADSISDGSAVLTPEGTHEDVHSRVSSEPEEHDLRGSLNGKSRKPRGYVPNDDANFRSRGMPESLMKADHGRSRAKLFSGSGIEDILHIVRSREQWAADPTLPRREKLSYQVSHTDEKRQMEATVGWNWYYDEGGRESFAEKQRTRTLSLEEGINYIPKNLNDNFGFLLGPYGRQKVFTLAMSQSIGIEEAWRTSFGDSQEKDSEGTRSSKRRRLGWILNVGTRVRCLDWAPNQHGTTQYLALAVAKASTSIRAATPLKAPAFNPSSASPSGVQIWAFHLPENPMGPARAPELQQVLCTEWGEITQLKWCPVPRARRDEDALGKDFVGLLAGVWSDGCARVLDVQLQKGQEAMTSYCRFSHDDSPKSAAFSASPRLLPLADTEEDIRPVTTCLTWLSATELALGYSNGTLGIYSIYPYSFRSSLSNTTTKNPANIGAGPPTATPAEPNSFPKEAHSSTKEPPNQSLLSPYGYDLLDTANADVGPWLFLQLHPTFVLSITTAYPTHPALLISSSLSGNLRLTSLRAPTTDYVLSTRTRTPPSSLAYCDSLLSVVTVEETSETLRLWGLRCFYNSLACGKLGSAPGPGQGIVDAGRCHSSVAIGGADGSVIVTNPMRKALGRKIAGWQQIVFKHEWVRRSGQGPRQGMSRITEGYKGEKINLGMKSKDSVAESTIHEEETAVTALSWNPNPGCGGWLAVGWGSGMIRIQDMAI